MPDVMRDGVATYLQRAGVAVLMALPTTALAAGGDAKSGGYDSHGGDYEAEAGGPIVHANDRSNRRCA